MELIEHVKQMAEAASKLSFLASGKSIEIVSSNESKDLRRREADIAIRNHPTQHPDLIARKVKTAKAYLYASKGFIKKHGPFKNKKELENMTFMGMADNTRWLKALQGIGIDVDESNFPIITDSHLVHWSIVEQGMAIGVVPDFAVKNNKVVEKVLKSLPGLPIETWVVSHRELRTSRRIRFVYDCLVEYINERS